MTRTAWAEATHQLRLDGYSELANDLEQEIHQLYQRRWNQRAEAKSSNDLKARLRGAADYPEIHGITKCNLQVMLWEAANALDAKNARIAKLEQGYANACQREDNLKDDLKASEAKCELMWEALREARDTLRDDRIGTTHMDDPGLYQRIWNTTTKVDAVLSESDPGLDK